MAALSSDATFWRWHGCRRSLKGQVSGFSKASSAKLRSNSLRTAGFSERRREKGVGGLPIVISDRLA